MYNCARDLPRRSTRQRDWWIFMKNLLEPNELFYVFIAYAMIFLYLFLYIHCYYRRRECCCYCKLNTYSMKCYYMTSLHYNWKKWLTKWLYEGSSKSYQRIQQHNFFKSTKLLHTFLVIHIILLQKKWERMRCHETFDRNENIQMIRVFLTITYWCSRQRHEISFKIIFLAESITISLIANIK